jgi:hypothetical protein
MDLTRPPRFSLKSLFVAVAILSVPLAVWCYVPDPNNTLPMDRIVGPPDLSAAPGAQDLMEPRIVVLGVETPAFSQPNKQYESFRLALVNPTPYSVRYSGYKMNSYSSRPPRGEIHPFHDMQVNTNGAWTSKPLFRCGTGAGELRIKPGHAGRFDVLHEVGEPPLRVGVQCRWIDRSDTSQSQMIWSTQLPAGKVNPGK